MVTVRFEIRRGIDWRFKAESRIDLELCDSTVAAVRDNLMGHCGSFAHRAFINGVLVGECEPGGDVVNHRGWAVSILACVGPVDQSGDVDGWGDKTCPVCGSGDIVRHDGVGFDCVESVVECAKCGMHNATHGWFMLAGGDAGCAADYARQVLLWHWERSDIPGHIPGGQITSDFDAAMIEAIRTAEIPAGTQSALVEYTLIG